MCYYAGYEMKLFRLKFMYCSQLLEPVVVDAGDCFTRQELQVSAYRAGVEQGARIYSNSTASMKGFQKNRRSRYHNNLVRMRK
jgi:hypothetical protein